MEHWMVTAPQFDGRFIGRYTQQWVLANGADRRSARGTAWATTPASDNGAQQWRDVYWSLGQNLVDMINKAEAEQRWDLAGVGYFMKAWGWMVLTDMHGEIIVKEAIDPTRSPPSTTTRRSTRTRRSSACWTWRSPICSAPTAPSTPTYLGKHGPHLQRRSHEVAEAGVWPAGAWPEPLLEQERRTSRPTSSPPSTSRSRATRTMRCSRTRAPTRPRATINFWGRTRNNITNYRQTQFVVEPDERHRFRRRSIRA